MEYETLAFLHLATILPAFLFATVIMFIKKGSETHKTVGRFTAFLLLISACISLAMPARVGPTFYEHFGLIHLLSLIVIFSVPKAYFAIKQGNVLMHKITMVNVYLGGFLIAGFLLSCRAEC
ncbi:putative membrane protein [Vibrio astriarenae]|nr:putative membrane protein [Vibrio sp. C7]